MYPLTLMHVLLLPLLGMVLAAVGTLVGLGGGFVLVPVLFILLPEASPGTITSISLTIVFLNAASATAGNLRARRIDMRTAALLTMGAIPAAVVGALASRVVSRERFEMLFGVLLVFGAVYVFWRGLKAASLPIQARRQPNRQIQERKGPLHEFYVNTLMAWVISPVAGFVAGFFGIGGGVIHVPAMTFILKIPPRVAGATALFVLLPTSLAGLLTRVASDQFTEGWRQAGLLGLGALVGAQVGLYLSARVNQRVVLFLLAVAMVMAGVGQVLAAAP